MRAFLRLTPVSAISTAVFIPLALLSVAQATQQNKSTKCDIKNFGCVNEKFYRGAQPKDQDYADLAAMGVKTVIDLQKGGPDQEQGLVEEQGMKFYRIGMSDKSQPAPEQVELFLRIVTDPANQPVFVHCAGGRHRTGAMSAIYRMTHDGWTADRAYQEMKQYDFGYGMGHGSLKHYVYDYYSHIEHKPVVVSTSSNR
jgi:protein tyrosine/serine phosphatase